MSKAKRDRIWGAVVLIVCLALMAFWIWLVYDVAVLTPAMDARIARRLDSIELQIRVSEARIEATQRVCAVIRDQPAASAVPPAPVVSVHRVAPHPNCLTVPAAPAK